MCDSLFFHLAITYSFIKMMLHTSVCHIVYYFAQRLHANTATLEESCTPVNSSGPFSYFPATVKKYKQFKGRFILAHSLTGSSVTGVGEERQLHSDIVSALRRGRLRR